MVKRKRKKIKKDLTKPKMPSGNEAYWLSVTKSAEEIMCFVERGNERQKKALKAAIEYRFWQIQEGAIGKDFWDEVGIEPEFLKIDVKAAPKMKRKVLYNGDAITPEEMKAKEEILKENKKVIKDLFDFSNIEDLTEQK